MRGMFFAPMVHGLELSGFTHWLAIENDSSVRGMNSLMASDANDPSGLAHLNYRLASVINPMRFASESRKKTIHKS